MSFVINIFSFLCIFLGLWTQLSKKRCALVHNPGLDGAIFTAPYPQTFLSFDSFFNIFRSKKKKKRKEIQHMQHFVPLFANIYITFFFWLRHTTK